MKEKEIIIYKINTCLKSFDIISLNAIYQAIKNLSDKKSKRLFASTIFDQHRMQ